MSDKAAIRRQMRARRKALPSAAKARAADVVRDAILSHPEVAAALEAPGGRATLAVYLASPDEIDLSAAIAALLARGVTVVAPRWNGATYALAKLKGLDDDSLRTGPMGIREPKDADPVSPRAVSVWLVPGLAFTRDGARLGYGGGWYDRLLAEADPQAKKYGIAHSFQILDALPTEPHDIRLEGVIFSSDIQ